MKLVLPIVLLFLCLIGIGQNQEEGVLNKMKRFHEMMVRQNLYIDQYIDDSLSYGHSNGWVENKKEFINNLGKMMIYHSFREDSIHVTVNGKAAHARFIADIDVTMNGKRNLYHLKVLEIWVRNKKTWKLFARQAVR